MSKKCNDYIIAKNHFLRHEKIDSHNNELYYASAPPHRGSKLQR